MTHTAFSNSQTRHNAQALRDLRLAVADLTGVNAWAGLLRFVSLGALTLSLAVLTWQMGHMGLFLLGAIATSVSYAFWLICNHDAFHRTLTGWNWFDALMPRLISWYMLWPLGTYNQLHRLHHAWNGNDLRDPERVQWTALEYQAAPSWQRWYVRHQWIINILFLSGAGLILKTFMHGVRLQGQLPQLRKQMIMDVVGMLGLQSIIFNLVALHAISLWKYLLFWLLLERGIGMIIQTRGHLEHYGKWQQNDEPLLCQLYACRNLKTFPWVNWLMGGLPYHAVHHAFPHIASNHLPEAFDRIQTILKRHQLPPMIQDPGYIASSLDLSKQPSLIK